MILREDLTATDRTYPGTKFPRCCGRRVEADFTGGDPRGYDAGEKVEGRERQDIDHVCRRSTHEAKIGEDPGTPSSFRAGLLDPLRRIRVDGGAAGRSRSRFAYRPMARRRPASRCASTAATTPRVSRAFRASMIARRSSIEARIADPASRPRCIFMSWIFTLLTR